MRGRSLLFVIFTLLEIAILIELGREYGTATVLIEIILSALLGWIVMRTVGRQTGIRARFALWNMELPAASLVKGFMTIVGGVLLVLPGILSDVIGLILILPPTQVLVIHRFKALYPRLFARY